MFKKLKDGVNSLKKRVEEKTGIKEDDRPDEIPEQPVEEEGGSKKQASEKASISTRAKKFIKERKVILDEDDVDDAISEFKFDLIENDVAFDVAEKIGEDVKTQLVGKEIKWREDVGEIVNESLKKSILDIFTSDFRFNNYIEEKEKPVVIIFVGTNGVGKTTTIAKLAKYLRKKDYQPVLANGDTFRAGALEQIEKHGEKLDLKVIKHQEGSDPAAVIYDAVEFARANNYDVVLGDTAGRMHTDINLMDQIKKIKRVSDPDLVFFVDEAVAGSDAVERAKQFDEAVDIDASILTKIDADVSGGSAISIAYATNNPIIFVGTGQSYDDLREFDPEWFVDEIVG
ncbi:signal recognition particle-docking protein FtsY [Methanonatronarchaeum sp. AMET6-2]|uniref:signal recognition particle-docking protein FtsY n=1 Tax=Methanonatronarchaeum sp. AMET6-2 TaxID=2933293 RepID=UPI001212159B|nr:signal recognition particle-docking protein FtsY [Methanonatronarchaeum sp. AMET6-2]RZN63478.1 MAG: signal recognition particle-docking protein FtsY [Methanonatronarchaeia archaeon]UOY09739.1 signal recognition particle-docking protein FtsY [Methanonatronarchaeum sp. AMET6-2]